MLRGGKDLPWEAAMHALTATNMDVDEACWTVQCGELQPLYECIFSEWNKVTKTDMEDIKKLIKKDDLEIEVVHAWIDCCFINGWAVCLMACGSDTYCLRGCGKTLECVMIVCLTGNVYCHRLCNS